MGEKVRVGSRGEIVIPLQLRKKLAIKHGLVLELEETREGIVLKPYDALRKGRGLGKGVFGDPVAYQRKLRREWKPKGS